MADSEPDQSELRRRNAQKQRQRRQTRNRIFSAVLAVALIVLAALWFSDTLRIPTEHPSLASGAETDKTPAAGKHNVTGAKKPEHRDINPLQPMRLWIGGDSLAGALGPSLGTMTAETGVVQPQYDSRVGSGLMSGDIDWPEHAQSQMDELNPEVVVFMIGTNDANVYSDNQEAEYAQKVAEMMHILVGTGREVYWVNAPVMRDDDLEARVKKVNEIQREVAATIPGVTFVDAHTLFADENGEYQSSLPDATGDDILMRAGDGIHLSGAGGDHLAEAIFALMDPRWRISAQTVIGVEKKVLVTKGSTQVGGSSSSSGSSSGGGSSSYNRNSGSSNTSGTTAPPVAQQPTETTQPTTATVPPTSSTTATPPST
jgi:hypothetical protein